MNEELWYSTGSGRRLGKRSAMRQLLADTLAPSEHRAIKSGLEGIINQFGALGEVAAKAGSSFEDANAAMRAMTERYGDEVASEPKFCVVCGDDAPRVKHYFDTAFMNEVPIWTRVCDECSLTPLCTATVWGVHASFISANSPDFEIKNTVVVDVNNMDDVGHCEDCGLPLIRTGPLSWRYWTPKERGRLLQGAPPDALGHAEHSK